MVVSRIVHIEVMTSGPKNDIGSRWDACHETVDTLDSHCTERENGGCDMRRGGW